MTAAIRVGPAVTDRRSRNSRGQTRLGAHCGDVGGVWAGQHRALFRALHAIWNCEAADNQVASIEADQAIEGGALMSATLWRIWANPNMLPPTNNYQVADVKVGEGMFWLIGRDTNDSEVSHSATEPSFGLVDEASKVNLNADGLTIIATNLLLTSRK